jgi:hypothetical protein
MSLTDQVLAPEALVSLGNSSMLSIAMPWFRSVPLSAIERLKVSISGEELDPGRVRLPEGDWVEFEELATVTDREWFPQDTLGLELTKNLEPGSEHEVTLEISLTIPNLVMPDGTVIQIPNRITRTLVVQSN